MSVCNSASDGNASVLVALFRTVTQLGELDRDELLEFCAPTTLTDRAQSTQGKAAEKTLNTWTEVGLFCQEKNKIRIDDDFVLENRALGASLDHIRRSVRKVIMLPENNDNFWENEKNRAADLTRGLAWAMCQDVFTKFFNPHAPLQEEEMKQMNYATKELCVFRNDTRWSSFKYWAQLLGFAWTDSTGTLQIDPTLAVRDVLEDLLEDGEEISLGDFRSKLAEKLPVLDDGVYWKKVREHIDPSIVPKVGKKRLSPALSRALVRLDSAEEIRLKQISDAEPFSLSCPAELTHSHLVRMGSWGT